MPIMLIVLAALAIAYRFYSAFLAANVAALDDSRVTPAIRLDDGQNYEPMNRWVLFGHHFAAISGAGPLIGPVLAIQFGYLPGLVWIVVGVCLAGAVQDMLVLAASVRHEGRSLAEIARAEISPLAGATASITILFVVVVALSGLGVVVVKALGGEEVALAAGTSLQPEAGAAVRLETADGAAGTSAGGGRTTLVIPAGTTMVYPNGAAARRGEAFRLVLPAAVSAADAAQLAAQPAIDLPAGVTQRIAGSAWGTFTIACTIPIALVVGLYMFKLRKGHVFEASTFGAIAVVGATVAGAWVPGSALEPWFSLTREQTILALCGYGFVAAVLPVWLLLCPRDYLSSFLKIGTIGLLVFAVLVANPQLEAPTVNPLFAGGGGPNLPGAIFPFCFICIMCGAISGFHSLVSSGTTPKMIARESDVRMIGYGAMLIEGLVGVVALLAAAALPQGDYWAINIDLTQADKYAEALGALNANQDNLAKLEEQVGGESLRGRTGGAVTLAVGMSQVFSEATRRVAGDRVHIEAVIKYWYHFAIMFEALFILTTIDAGTRVARFLLQEALGKIYKPFERTDWLPGAIIATALVTAGWGGLIASGSIDTIWPMFGIANQMLAVIALSVVTSAMINAGRGRYAPLTILPMCFVVTTTATASYQMITGRFWSMAVTGMKLKNNAMLIKGSLNIFFTSFIVLAVSVILFEAIARWLTHWQRSRETAL